MQTDLVIEQMSACLVMGIRRMHCKRETLGYLLSILWGGDGFTGVYKCQNVSNLNMWFIVYQLHHSKAVIKTLRMAQSPHCLRTVDAHAWTLRREVEEWGWGYGGWAGRDPGGRRPNSINALAAAGAIPETDALGLRADPMVSNFPAPRILGPEPGAGLDTGRGGALGSPTAPPTAHETHSCLKSWSQARPTPSHKLGSQAPPRVASTAPPKAPPFALRTPSPHRPGPAPPKTPARPRPGPTPHL